MTGPRLWTKAPWFWSDGPLPQVLPEHRDAWCAQTHRPGV